MKRTKSKSKLSNFIFVTVTVLLAALMAFSFCYGAIKSVASLVHADVSTSAKALCLIEASSGRVLAEKNSNASLPMASTTKIMTAITALDNCENIDEVFEVSPKAIGVPGTSLYLRKGEKHSLRDLLYGLMLVSGNDASVAIGEHVSGSVEHFVDQMNFTAHRLGLKHTHFENTHGLDEDGHYTSAYDLAKIAAYALENPVFKEIVSTQNKKITSADGKDRYLANKNKLLRTFDGAIGVKTGFTDDAGRCLVSAAERDGMRLICVVLNCGPMFEDCARLLEWGFENYKMYDLTQKVEFYPELVVEGGEKQSVKIGHNHTFMYPLADWELDKISTNVQIVPSLKPVLKAGSEVGKFEILFDKELLFSGNIVTMEDVKARSFEQRIFDILDQW